MAGFGDFLTGIDSGINNFIGDHNDTYKSDSLARAYSGSP